MGCPPCQSLLAAQTYHPAQQLATLGSLKTAQTHGPRCSTYMVPTHAASCCSPTEEGRSNYYPGILSFQLPPLPPFLQCTSPWGLSGQNPFFITISALNAVPPLPFSSLRSQEGVGRTSCLVPSTPGILGTLGGGPLYHLNTPPIVLHPPPKYPYFFKN